MRKTVNKIAVLITSAGVGSAINVIKSLRLQRQLSITLIAIDTDKLAPGLRLADYHYISPAITKTDVYLNFLFEICKKHSVNALFPCYSKELSLVSKAKDEFEKNGVKLLIPSPDVIELCNDKVRMGETVRELGILAPKIYKNPSAADVPLFSKLMEGSSSKGAYYVDNEHFLKSLLSSGEQRVYQEYIKGDEYTVDALCDWNSNVLFCGPRKRIQTKAGQSVKGITLHDKDLSAYTKKICSAIKFVGVCNIQFIKRGDKFYFIEFNPRFAAGGLMLTVHAGANLPLAALKLMLGLAIDKSELKHRSNISMTRYWQEIIIND